MNIINKIAFLVHAPTLYVHYSDVWSQMQSSEFVVVLMNRCDPYAGDLTRGANELIKKIKKHGYQIDHFSNIVSRGYKYKYVVSNQRMEGTSLFPCSSNRKFINESKNVIKRLLNHIGAFWGRKKIALIHGDPVQYQPIQAGIKQIRFLYGADMDNDDWNKMYDLFLCHGPNDVSELNKKFKGKTALMGYPRYDSYFNKDLDISDVVDEFDIDAGRKTILWMPTTARFACSIEDFARSLSGLMENFNVIVRPHPFIFCDYPEWIELLCSYNYKIDSDPMRDMNVLYKAVDFVLCDYGGSSFGAIYLDKNLILLDFDGSKHSFALIKDPILQIRDYFPVIHPEDSSKIEMIIKDEQIWEDQKKNRQTLFSRYFADNRGESSRCAAEILAHLDALLG